MKKKSDYLRFHEPLSNFQKLLLPIRITFILLVCSMLNAMASSGNSGVEKTSLSLNNTTIDQATDKIEASNAVEIQLKVSGTVLNANKEPVPGVTVLVKGTTIGTLTDAEGKYTLSNLPTGSVLVFSFMGMQTQDIEIGNRSTINVVMLEESIGLEEVVVIGYGTQRKRDVSTSIASVSADNLKDKPVANFQQAMSGQLAGVRILTSNNAPGGGSIIRIRGVNSINATNDPLIVT